MSGLRKKSGVPFPSYTFIIKENTHMKNLFRNASVVTLGLLFLAGPVTAAHAEEPVQAINPPYSTSTEQPVGGITPPAQVLIDATDRGLTVTSDVRYINGVQWVETTTGNLFSNPSGAYTRTIDPLTGATVALNPFGMSGDNYLSPKTVVGTHVKGAIKALYLDSLGGPDAIGYPTSNEVVISGGVKQTFRTASGKLTDIYWSSATGAKSVSGSIRTKVNGLGISVTGFPKTQEFSVTGGVRQTFSKGYATWKSTTGTVWTKTA